MATFEISLFPAARWDDEAECMVLGERSRVLSTLEAAYPALAREAALPVVQATHSETTHAWQQVGGKRQRVTVPAYAPGQCGTAAWWTAEGLAVLHPAEFVPSDV